MFFFAARAKVLPDLLEGLTEALGRGKRTKAQYRVIPLFHPAVILLDPPIEIGAAAMLDFAAKHLADRARIRIVAIAGDLRGTFLDNGESATKEALGCRHIPRRTEHRVDQIAFAINRTIQVSTICL